MAVYIDREITIQAIREVPRGNWSRDRFIAEVMSIPEADVVKRDCYDRILWENDIMRKQLSDIGNSFGEKMDDVQKVVHAKWEWNDRNGYYYCSECNAASPREDQEGEYCDTPMYCHKCGAKMDLE